MTFGLSALAGLGLAAALGGSVANQDLKSVTVKDLDYLVGNWTTEIWGGQFDEFWLPSQSGTMQGAGRFISEGKVVFMEFSSLEPSKDGLVLYMVLGQPSKGAPKVEAFPISEFKNRRAVFTSPTNDYPSQIIYEPSGKGGLKCTLVGKEGGQAKTDVFDFRPMKRSSSAER